MVRIEVTQAAYDVLLSSLPDGWTPLEPQVSDMGNYYLWLDRRSVAQLAALRRPGEGFSEVVLRLARMERELEPG